MTVTEFPIAQNWRCVQCREGSLNASPRGFHCPKCGQEYPVTAGIPILVKNPVEYMRSEVSALKRASRNATKRRSLLGRAAAEAGLTDATIDRHRDVLDAEVARAEMFLDLLEPVNHVLEAMASTSEPIGKPRSGWGFDSLFPYLLRDWTESNELESASSMIGGAIARAFSDPRSNTIAVAGCGAGGLLARLAQHAGCVFGYDLTLPVLCAARHLLDGKSLDLAIPHVIHDTGRICLRSPQAMSGSSGAHMLAMDAFDTAFPDESLDCVITSFLIDLIPEPGALAHEVHRILRHDGVWINYGPSGPLNGTWRFDGTEGAAFFESCGFEVVHNDSHRATYLDLSRSCPSWSFQSHICYLTSARKTTKAFRQSSVSAPNAEELPTVVPLLYPDTNITVRQALGAQQPHKIHLRYERIPGRRDSAEVSDDTARILVLVDGKRTVREIAEMLQEGEARPVEQTLDIFATCFRRHLLTRTV